jgi:signal transduction histidine kinase
VDSRRTIEQLSDAVLAVTRQLSVGEVLQSIVNSARDLLDAEYAALGVPDDQGGFAEFVVAGVPDEQWAAIGELPRQHGILGVMLRDAKPQRLPDIRRDPRFGWWPKAHPVLKDFLGMPIRHGEDILGAIYLANRRGGDGGFGPEDERLLAVLAAHAAIALINARLYERTRELTLIEERQRMARDLHDAVAQKLFSLRLTADAAATLVRRDPDRAEAELAEVGRLAAEAADELRQVVAELLPRELSATGLPAALATRVSLLDRVHRAHVSFHAGPDLPRLAAEREETVLRVAEEALHNALRHASATTVTVTLQRLAECGLALTVTDDGTGFDADHPPQAAAARLGLTSMRERARAAGGSLAVASALGTGTTVRLAVP